MRGLKTSSACYASLLAKPCNDVCSFIPARQLLRLLAQKLRVAMELLALLAGIEKPRHSLTNTIGSPGRIGLRAAHTPRPVVSTSVAKLGRSNHSGRTHVWDTYQDSLVVAIGGTLVHEGHYVPTLQDRCRIRLQPGGELEPVAVEVGEQRLLILIQVVTSLYHFPKSAQELSAWNTTVQKTTGFRDRGVGAWD